MTEPSDKTRVQRPAQDQRTKVNAKPIRDTTIVMGKPGLDRIMHTEPESKVSVGSVLKQRFELIELLGAGGMGTVYKARDLRQVEAGDSDPWVALKVINESFSKHESALTALQQETKKTQRLSHPNIISAYDFDRDGLTAFMTMEFLEGQSLDKLLLDNPSGLDLDVANGLIQQMTQAMIYAHQRGVVHADLKPANVFLCTDGTVKVLDFGIAQAIHGDYSGFDAQSLNAFTPAYASINMLMGQRPVLQDDLYGAGCVFYLMLTGRHPFNRCKATEADASQMQPERIRFIRARQWHAMQKLLALHPKPSNSIDQFHTDFFSQNKLSGKQVALLMGGVFALVLGAILLWNWFANQRLRDVTDQLSNMDVPSIIVATQRLPEFNGIDQTIILDDARDSVIENVHQLIDQLSQAAQYQQLAQLFSALLPIYPDSSALSDLHVKFKHQLTGYQTQLEETIESQLDTMDFNDKTRAFNAYIDDLALVAPEHPWITQPIIMTRMAKAASLAGYLGNTKKANEIIDQALILYPQEERFHKVRDRIARTLKSKQNVSTALSPLEDQHLLDFQQAIKSQESKQWVSENDVGVYLQYLQQQWPEIHQFTESALLGFFESEKTALSPEVAALKKQWFSSVNHAPVVRKKDPCSRYYSDKGSKEQYRCFDTISSRHHGPELVVVSGTKSLPSFAVSRMEITVDDFNHYCRMHGRCAARSGGDLPITDISFAQAKAYTQWLSKMTGYTYRLPNAEEWRRFAMDDSGVQDHNCIVQAGGRLVRGDVLRSAFAGYQNSLGLLNVFGNAEEWIENKNRAMIVGGSAQTDIKYCNDSAQSITSMDANSYRGFRVVRH